MIYSCQQDLYYATVKFYKTDLTGQSYKSFYICNLHISVLTRAFIQGKPYQPSLMFAGKAGDYPSELPFRCCTLGKAPDLNHKH